MSNLKGFRTAKGLKIEEKRLIEEIKNFILFDKNFKYKVIVGTDSEDHKDKVEFISVIVVHRIGYGARFFWKRSFTNSTDLYSRLWQEALFSLELSKELLFKLIEEKLEFEFEVHLDLGTNGKSNSVVKEIINLIRGYGFEVKVKPYSFAASKIADHLL